MITGSRSRLILVRKEKSKGNHKQLKKMTDKVIRLSSPCEASSLSYEEKSQAKYHSQEVRDRNLFSKDETSYLDDHVGGNPF